MNSSFLLQTCEPFLTGLWKISWQVALLIGLVLSLQVLFGKWLNVRWRYNLWFIVLIRLMMPFNIENNFSIFNLTQFNSFKEVQILPAIPTLQENDSLDDTNQHTLSIVEPSKTLAHAFFLKNWKALVSILWLFGVVIGIARITLGYHWLISRSSKIRDDNSSLFNLLEECKAALGIKRSVELIESEMIKSPALIGLFQPKLFLTQRIVDRFHREELRFIFLHELSHLKRGDHWVNGIMMLLQVIHWFNPIVWLGFCRMRADRELACDALALSRSGERQNKDYGRTILKLVDQLCEPALLPGMVGILESKKDIEKRMRMIAQFSKKSYYWSNFTLILVLGLMAVTLTSAKSTKEPEKSISQHQTSSKSKIEDKLNSIIIKKLELNETSIESAINLLITESRKADPSPQKEGVNIIMAFKKISENEGEAASTVIPIFSLHSENVTLLMAIQFITQITHLSYHIEPDAVIIDSQAISSKSVQMGTGTAGEFLKAYFLIQEGDLADKSGGFAKSIEKYSEALAILRTIKRTAPDWNPKIITYRIKYCIDRILSFTSKEETVMPEDKKKMIDKLNSIVIKKWNLPGRLLRAQLTF